MSLIKSRKRVADHGEVLTPAWMVEAILLHKPSQNTTRHVYTFVPAQDWTKRWTDEEPFKKYGITEEEQAFLDKVVRPMDLCSEDD